MLWPTLRITTPFTIHIPSVSPLFLPCSTSPVVCSVSLCAKAPSRDLHKSSHLFEKDDYSGPTFQLGPERREEKRRKENADNQWSLIHIGVNVIDFPLWGICQNHRTNAGWIVKRAEKIWALSQSSVCISLSNSQAKYITHGLWVDILASLHRSLIKLYANYAYLRSIFIGTDGS